LGSSFLTQFQEISSFGTATYSSRLVSRLAKLFFAGTFDASAGGGTGLVASVTAEGTAVGLTAGQVLPAASTTNNRYYLVVSEAGTITSGNAPNVALSPPDIISVQR
jgi:hypothetical protein